MSGSKGINRQQMADLIARQFQDGWVVNLGVGIPTIKIDRMTVGGTARKESGGFMQ